MEAEMNIAICDDEAFFRNTLSNELEIYARKYGLHFIMYKYKDGNSLLSSDISYDLIFMDFQLENKNGIDTVDALRKRNDNTKVVFISSYKDVVFDSMKVNTFRFLVKPLEREKLYEALDSVIKESKKTYYIAAKDESNQKNVTVAESKIIYIQADNIYATIITEKEIYKYQKSISCLQKELRSDFFYRTNRSYIVNFNYIAEYNNKEVTFINGQKALISKPKYKDFKNKYLNYLKMKSIGE